MQAITQITIPNMKLVKRGKVRDIFDFGDHLLIVASDRISAFDYIMPNGIPDKGKILTQIARFWFEKTGHIIQNHLITTTIQELPPVCQPYAELLAQRSMLVLRTTPLPVECIVRGYLSGSGWKDYQKTGAISGIQLPPGLQESQRLDQPIFTPSTKSDVGHDENLSFAKMTNLIGSELAARVREVSIQVYDWARRYTEVRGIMIADTKFEFGLRNDQLYLIDEIFTPDSSRFWPQTQYEVGRPQISFDKQYLRDWLESIGWNKQPPVPTLPLEVIHNTRTKYLEALHLLTGETL